MCGGWGLKTAGEVYREGWLGHRLEGECLFRPIPATGHGSANDGELDAKKGSRGKVCVEARV